MPNPSVLDESDSVEFFFEQLQQLINASMASASETGVSDISEIVAFCSQRKDIGTSRETEKYGHIFLSHALLNLLPEKVAYLCAHDDFLAMLASKIHHQSHLLEMYDLIPHENLFKFFSKIIPSMFFRFRDTELVLDDVSNVDYLKLWLLTLYGPGHGGTLLIHSPLDFIRSLDKQVLFEFIHSSPSRLLLLMRLMKKPKYPELLAEPQHEVLPDDLADIEEYETSSDDSSDIKDQERTAELRARKQQKKMTATVSDHEKQKELLDYLNEVYATERDIFDISNKKRPAVWYSGVNFVMAVLLRPDGYKAYYHGSKKALPEETRLLTSYIRHFDHDIDNGEALAMALDLMPAHLQRQFIDNLIAKMRHKETDGTSGEAVKHKPEPKHKRYRHRAIAEHKQDAKHHQENNHTFAELFTSPFQVNAVLESLHFRNTKKHFIVVLYAAAPSDTWLDNLYRRGRGVQKALSSLERSPDYELMAPYLRRVSHDLTTRVADGDRVVAKPVSRMRYLRQPAHSAEAPREEVIQRRRATTSG